MNLTWHIAQKDVRRLALPVALWIGLIVLPTVAFRMTSPTVEGHLASTVDAYGKVLSIWVRLLVGVQLVMGALLAAALVTEDALVGTTEFWATRPIARWRLLIAKMMAAALLFLVAPVLALAPVWFASGFSVGEAWLAAAAFAKWQGGATLVALMIASLSRNLAQFVLIAIALFVGLVAAIWLSTPVSHALSVPMRWSRDLVIGTGMLLVVAFVLAQQFLTRRPGRAWLTLAVAFFVGIGIRVMWPRDILPEISPVRSSTALERLPEDRAAEIVVAPTFTKFRPNSLPTLFITAGWNRDRFYLPIWARFSDGTIGRGAHGAGGVQAGLRALGFDHEVGPLRWQIMAPRLMQISPDEPHLTGTLEVWSARTRFVGEMPVQAGAEIAAGANRTRIIALGRKDDRLDQILLMERDAHSAAVGRWTSNRPVHSIESLRYIDRYFLLNRATGKAQSASASDLGAIEMNSLVMRFVRLHVSGTSDWRDGVLVKLRYEREHRFERAFEVRGVTANQPRLQP